MSTPTGEGFVPAGQHGLGSDADPACPTPHELDRERLEREAPDVLLRRRGPGDEP